MRAAEHPILRLAVEQGLLDPARLEQCLRPGAGPCELLERLVAEGELDDRRLAELLAEKSGLSFVELGSIAIAPDAIGMLSQELAMRYTVFPIAREDSRLRLAVCDPFDFEGIDNLGHFTRLTIEPVVAAVGDIRAAIRRHCKGEAPAAQGGPTSGDTAPEDDEAPVIQLVEGAIREAARRRASDIHFEPLARRFRIRYRIDGVLREAGDPPQALQRPVSSRLKIMAGLSIAEKRLPQDGRARFRLDRQALNLRISSMPTVHGESVVVRLLENDALRLDLAALGMSPADRKDFTRSLAQPHGLVLVTGPTGSGKTTTLYACLRRLNHSDRKIITVEDPVEYQISGINQVPVRPETGLTFATALRAMLRQSPDIIMIGEIRDAETAEIAVNAALTGHLVLSTLHTKDAAGAVTRLFDLGIRPFLVSSVLRAVLAQRLVRRVCARCAGMGRSGAGICPQCDGTGFRGRLGLFELLVVDEAVSRCIAAAARPGGRLLAGALRPLLDDGMSKVRAGLTTLEEIQAVAPDDANGV